MTYPQHVSCPACDTPVLLVAGSRRGGTPTAFDPEPLIGGEYDTRLSDDLSHVAIASSAPAAATLRGSVPLYRLHQRSCSLRVPAGRPCPSWAGYSQAAAAWRGEPVTTPVTADESLPRPWEGIKGTIRDHDDLLSLDDLALPRRRMMMMMTLRLHRAVTAVPPSPEARLTAERIRDPQPGDLVTETSSDHKGIFGFGVLLGRRREQSGGITGCEARGNDLAAAGLISYVQYGPDAGNVARWDCARFITVHAEAS